MYILSDIEGKLIQKSNVKIDDLQKIINRFSNELGIEVIGTDDETLYLKTEETGYFDIIIENNEIVDIIPKEKIPVPKPLREPTLEEEVKELKQLVADLASLQLGV